MNFTEKQKNIAVFLLYFAFAGVILFLISSFGKYIIPLIMPFIIAWLIAWILQPAIKFITTKTKIPRSISTIILIFLISGIIVFLGYIVVAKLLGELNTLSTQISAFLDRLKDDTNRVDELISKINSYIPFFDFSDELKEYWVNLDSNIIKLIQSFGARLSSEVIPFLSKTVSFVADFFVVSIIFLVAVYYFAVDFTKINSFVLHQFPQKPKEKLMVFKTHLFTTVFKYLKAYSLIILITFVELLVAFLVLDISYPYLVALIAALVDILPIVGTGTILVPWGIFLIVKGDLFTGIGLLVVYIIITIIRQIIEPKIVGSYIGMYPLITLIMMYTGLKAFGIIGLFAFPILSIIIKNLNDAGDITLWKYPDGITPNTKPKKRFKVLNQKIHSAKNQENKNNGQ
jgi:sporulation integral membrane protein YtvI